MSHKDYCNAILEAKTQEISQYIQNLNDKFMTSAYSLLRQRSEPRLKEKVKTCNPYSLFQCQHTLGGHIGIHSVAISPDSQTLVSGGGADSYNRRNTLKTWNLGTGAEIHSLEGSHSADINYVAISPDGQHMASGSTDATIAVWDLKTGRQIYSLKGHSGPVFTVAIHPDKPDPQDSDYGDRYCALHK